jgi:hypothetical protein
MSSGTAEVPASCLEVSVAPDTWWQKIEARGSEILDVLKNVLHEGNVRRVVIKQRDHTIAEFPLTVGVVGTVAAPILAAVGALVALLADCTIEVERTGTPPPPAADVPPPPGV